MLIKRPELRLALTAGLATGFGAITAMPFNYYLGLTVLAVSTGSYGGVIGLGRQRLLGSLLGSFVLAVSLHGLEGLPMPLALALAMAALRLLGGLLNLKVGYKVGGMIVVMGWLVHGHQLGEWLHLRLFWTALGIFLSLLSLRLFWPSSAATQSWREFSELFNQLAITVQEQADRLRHSRSDSPPDRGGQRRTIAALRARLASLRALRPQVRDELGTPRLEHPMDRLLERFETTCSRLIGVVQGLESSRSRDLVRLPDTEMARGLSDLPAAEAALLDAVAVRLRQWHGELLQLDGRSQALPPPPQAPLRWPDPWRELDDWLQSSMLETIPLERLQPLAGRLVLCRQAQQLIEHTEAHWRERSHG